MLDDKPDNPHDDAGWFRHFRMTKYLPAITGKFDAAMQDVESDAKATKAVMTAYSATALDILIHTQTPPSRMAADLADTFNLSTDHFLLLQTDDFARLAQRSEMAIHETLSKAGFLVDRGTVVGFRLPADATRPRPPQPPAQKPPKL